MCEAHAKLLVPHPLGRDMPTFIFAVMNGFTLRVHYLKLDKPQLELEHEINLMEIKPDIK